MAAPVTDDVPRGLPADPPPLPDPKAALAGALSRPLGLPALATFVEPGDRVALVIDPSLPGGEEWVRPVVEEALAAAAPSRISTLGGEPKALGRVSGLGIVRVDGVVADADKLIWVSALCLEPGGGLEETAVRLVECVGGRAFVGGRDGVMGGSASLPEASGFDVGGALDLLPPTFLVEIAFQRGVRPAAIFAGGIREAHRAAMAFHRRWPGAALRPSVP